MSFVLQAPMVILEDAILQPGHVTISGGVITAVGQGTFGAAGTEHGGDRNDEAGSGLVGDGGGSGLVGDGAGSGPAGDGDRPDLASRVPVVKVDAIVAAGFVDVHVHGGDGAQVNGDSAAEIAASVALVARFHARHGTTSLLATTVSDTPDRLASTVAGVRDVVRSGLTGGTRVLGVHLEGPWIARAKMGAQDPSALRLPDVGEFRSLVEAGEGCIRMVTLAPELTGAAGLIAAAVRAGVQVAIGHTDADFDTARDAIDAGARHATHLFNAMAPIHHRRPGALTAVLLDERVTLEVIADLEHVHPAVLRMAARLAPGRLVAVSDAVPAAGLEPGAYQLGRQAVIVSDGRVTLASDPATLAGSTLTMDRAISNLISAVGLPIEAAFAAGSAVGARAVGSVAGLEGLAGLGTLTPGAPADLVVLQSSAAAGATLGSGVGALGGGGVEVLATLVGGRAVWDPGRIFAETHAAVVAPSAG